MATVGIHLIWTTYGTWLPGDRRGHWSPLFDFYRHVIDNGGKLNPHDIETRQQSSEQMKEIVKILNEDEIKLVAATIGTLVPFGEETPTVHAAAIEPAHVHLLLGSLEESVGIVAGRFKGRTSSEVLALPENKDRERTWTAKYWKVFLFDDTAFAAVKKYIEDHNVRRGLPPAPYPWISPI